METKRQGRLYQFVNADFQLTQHLHARLQQKDPGIQHADLTEEEASLLPWPDSGHPFIVLALRCVERNLVTAAAYLFRLSDTAGRMIASEAALKNPDLLKNLVSEGYRVSFEDLLDLLTEDHVSVFERLKGVSPPEPDKIYWAIFQTRLSDDALVAAIRTWPVLSTSSPLFRVSQSRLVDIKRTGRYALMVLKHAGLPKCVTRKILLDNYLLYE